MFIIEKNYEKTRSNEKVQAIQVEKIISIRKNYGS